MNYKMSYITNDVSVITSTIVELGYDGIGDSRVAACTGVDRSGNRWSWVETNGGPFAVYEGCELDDNYIGVLRDTMDALSAIDADHAAWLELELDRCDDVLANEETQND